MRLGGRMTTSKLKTAIPRFALEPVEAAASIGVGPKFFGEHVRPDLRVVRRGSKVLVPCAELERWVERNAEHTIDTAA
jgi:hypothetical protein